MTDERSRHLFAGAIRPFCYRIKNICCVVAISPCRTWRGRLRVLHCLHRTSRFHTILQTSSVPPHASMMLPAFHFQRRWSKRSVTSPHMPFWPDRRWTSPRVQIFFELMISSTKQCGRKFTGKHLTFDIVTSSAPPQYMANITEDQPAGTRTAKSLPASMHYNHGQLRDLLFASSPSYHDRTRRRVRQRRLLGSPSFCAPLKAAGRDVAGVDTAIWVATSI